MKTIRKFSLLSLLLLPSLCFSAERESPKRLSPINRDFPDQYKFYDGTIGRIKILKYSPDRKNFTFSSEDHDPGAVFWGKTENLIQKNNRMRKKYKLPTDFSWFTQDEQVFETVEEREEYLRKKKKK